jgi:predicted nucleic acid-binding protein
MTHKLFIDTSWYKAIIDPKDDFHKIAIDQFEEFRTQKVFFITTNFVIDESLTLIRTRCGLATALKFSDMLVGISKAQKIVRVTELDEKEAWNWFSRDWSKLSFTDCTSFAVMNRLDVIDVATFDQHFAKAGFIIFK